MSGMCKSSEIIKTRAFGIRIGAFFGKCSRTGLELGVCYKILTANSSSNFRPGSTINGCGEILKWNDKNKRSASLVL
jgi:hypothetical protein